MSKTYKEQRDDFVTAWVEYMDEYLDYTGGLNDDENVGEDDVWFWVAGENDFLYDGFGHSANFAVYFDLQDMALYGFANDDEVYAEHFDTIDSMTISLKGNDYETFICACCIAPYMMLKGETA